jgi:hypothetical protein
MNFLDTPFAVPVAGCLMILGLGVAGIYSEMRGKELRSQERIAMIARGVPMAEIERLMSTANEEEKKVRDPLRSLGNARRTAMVLLSLGVGLILFGFILFAVVQHRPVLVVSGVGVLNIAMGLGFLFDYNMQKRELSRFGMEVDAEPGFLQSQK